MTSAVAIVVSLILAGCAPELTAEPVVPVTHSALAPQMACAPRGGVVEALSRQYGEHQIAGGISSSGWLIELYSSADGSTWTIIASSPQGMSCAVSSGEGWRRLEPPGPHLGPGA